MCTACTCSHQEPLHTLRLGVHRALARSAAVASPERCAPVSRALATAVCLCTGCCALPKHRQKALVLAFCVSNWAEAEESQKASAVSKRQTVHHSVFMYVCMCCVGSCSCSREFTLARTCTRSCHPQARKQQCLHQATGSDSYTVTVISRADIVSIGFSGSDSFCSCRSDCLPLTCWLYGCPICFGCT